MEALFVDDRQLITLLHVSGVTQSIVFGHRCRARRVSRYLKSSISWYLDWQLSIYWDVTGPLITVLMSFSTHTCVMTHCRCHPSVLCSVSLPHSSSISEFPKMSAQVSPSLPTHLSPHWHHFSPAPPLWPLSLSNSELRPIFTHRLSPLLSSL